MVSIQSSHTSPLQCKCFSFYGNLMSCSCLTPWLCSFSYLFYDDVICGISCFCSFNYISHGDVIYGTIPIYLTTCTTISIALTIVGTADGSIVPFIISCAFKYMLTCSIFTLKPKAPPSSTLFFLLNAFIEEFVHY